jgi:hypothetical protein
MQQHISSRGHQFEFSIITPRTYPLIIEMFQRQQKQCKIESSRFEVLKYV